MVKSAISFLETYHSENTVISYSNILRQYLSVVFGVEVTKLSIEDYANRYFAEERNFSEDVEKFWVYLKDRPPKTIKTFMACVRVFLLENGHELDQLFWRHMNKRIKGNRALTLDRIPSNQELKTLIGHMPIQGKALYLLLATSGMRIGEALSLRMPDLDFDKDPVWISIGGNNTKTGNSRVAFISSECCETLKEWLKYRDQYIATSLARSKKNPKTDYEDRLFPYEPNVAYMLFFNALKKAGLTDVDAYTGRLKLHPHVLRKFFRTRLGSVINADIAEALMGHEQGLTDVYRKYSIDELADFYKKGEGSLFIFSNGQEVTKLRNEVEEKNRQLQTVINGLTSENYELKGRLDKLEKQLEYLRKELPVCI